MTSPTVLLDVDQQPGKPPMLRTDALGDVATLRVFVAEHGALLLRGLGLGDATEFGAVFRQMGTLLTEREAFAPRRLYEPGVYSASTWPPNQAMCLHHELSYAREPPGLMLFGCLVAPGTGKGGATPIADSAAVLHALPPNLVASVERLGWLLVRNYHEDFGASVADAFGTDDRGEIERYCRANGIDFEWRQGGGLRTRQRRSGVVRHPINRRRCWFNQIAFLNEWTMIPEVREYLVDVYGADGLPFNTCFGNGDPIGPDIVEVINHAYERHTVREPWQAGDLLVVDNVRCAHGREPFEGSREIVVALADAVSPTAV